MILDFGAKSTPSRVLSLFTFGRLHSLQFVHRQYLSQEASNQFYYGHAKYISISSNEVVETCAWRSNTLSLIVTLNLDTDFLMSYFRHKNGIIKITKGRFFLLRISYVLRLFHDTLIFSSLQKLFVVNGEHVSPCVNSNGVLKFKLFTNVGVLLSIVGINC